MNADDIQSSLFASDFSTSMASQGLSPSTAAVIGLTAQNQSTRTTAGQQAAFDSKSITSPASCEAAYEDLVVYSSDLKSMDPLIFNTDYSSSNDTNADATSSVVRVFASAASATKFLKSSLSVSKACESIVTHSPSGTQSLSERVTGSTSSSGFTVETSYDGKVGFITNYTRINNVIVDIGESGNTGTDMANQAIVQTATLSRVNQLADMAAQSAAPSAAASTSSSSSGNGQAWLINDSCPSAEAVSAASGWPVKIQHTTDGSSIDGPTFTNTSDATGTGWKANTCVYSTTGETGNGIYLATLTPDLGQTGKHRISMPNLGAGANMDTDPVGSSNQCDLVVPATSSFGWAGGYSVEFVALPSVSKKVDNNCRHLLSTLKTIASQTVPIAAAQMPADPTPSQLAIKYAVECGLLGQTNTLATTSGAWGANQRVDIWGDAQMAACDDAAGLIATFNGN